MKSIDIHALLPVGEKLKPLLNKSVVTESDMKNILRKRGVFLGEIDKKKIIPYLTMSLLSPKEFEELQELQKSKEDSMKFRNLIVQGETELKLADMLPVDLIDVEQIDDTLSNCTFNTDVNFQVIDSNKLIVEYEISREDITKDWANAESKFTGRIEISKDATSKEIKFVSEFTSTETEDINTEIIKKVSQELKSINELGNDTKIFEITSDKLDNEERFKFLLSLAKDSSNGILRFKSVRNIEIGPDKSTNLVLTGSPMILDNSVKNIIINGEKGETLQNIEYVTNTMYHKVLILRAMQVEYRFKIGSAHGNCIIEYGFPHFFRSYKKSKEFEVTINRVWFGKNSVGESVKSASRKILNEFNEFYQYEFNKIKSDNEADDVELSS
ncbi:hypothetical protein C4A75_14430 [Brevibacillus laterosporus]|uniref:hypothetical protein n=1 Tax=Brevibacillus laterosporus TaxID=1465 RepID=UPI000CE39DC8|nr:hypothetical protein [Brevibacillus laterosporus]PPA83911.1 hypothetical protein C4A75_14430 [Brevibacillus laterosporus]